MPRRFLVLLVDADEAFRSETREALKVEGLGVSEAADLGEARRLLEEQEPDALITGSRLPDGSGTELLPGDKARPGTPLVVVTMEHPEARDIVECMRRGALDVLEKPVFPERLLGILLPALEERRVSRRRSRQETSSPRYLSRPPIVGESPALRQVLDQVGRVAGTPSTTVLIQGESGTGKELVARAIHYDGHRKSRPFMAINCAALNEAILEAELFGYEKGAFTGATSTGKKGLFEAADGGTVFLDEIGEMSGGLQAKLLRVLQENSFKRVGGVQDVRVDIRIIAATNRDLWREVESGRFRKDLYFRLNVMPIRVPPLRERKEDVVELARFFLQRIAGSMRKTIQGLSREAEQILAEHPWPGNVRELRNVCEYAVIVCDGRVIEPRHLALPETPGPAGAEPEAEPPAGTSGGGEQAEDDATLRLPVKDFSLRTMEEELIRMVLAETRFNVSRAARALGINRSTLYNKMRDYGLSRTDRRAMRHIV